MLIDVRTHWCQNLRTLYTHNQLLDLYFLKPSCAGEYLAVSAPLLQPHVCYIDIDMVGWQLTAGPHQLRPATSCGLTAALLRSVSTHQLRSGRRDRRRPAAPTPGPRAEGNICCDQTLQQPPASPCSRTSGRRTCTRWAPSPSLPPAF